MAGRPRRRASRARKNKLPTFEEERALVTAHIMRAAQSTPGYGTQFELDGIQTLLEPPAGLWVTFKVRARSVEAAADISDFVLDEIVGRLPPAIVRGGEGQHGKLSAEIAFGAPGDREANTVYPSVGYFEK